jgi:hypothetical protein
MSAKLGNGLYWLACIVAVLVLLLGSSVVFTALPQSIVGRNPLAAYVVLLAGAFVVWLRGLRYILAGPPAPLKEDQLVERISKLEQRIDAVDTRLARFEETVGPQLKTIADLLRSAFGNGPGEGLGNGQRIGFPNAAVGTAALALHSNDRRGALPQPPRPSSVHILFWKQPGRTWPGSFLLEGPSASYLNPP